MRADGSTTYAYDFANRLISTTLGGATTQFAYNRDGIRMRLVEAGTLTTYTHDYASPLPVVLQAK
ncbi:MAG TPA: type IV secretion protein Rhs, partial [Anaerolineae bacterium]|nr:type IV secretion protein Rhs [Anaerolineae bacterium]